MSYTTAVNSRYPRPLKATRPFQQPPISSSSTPFLLSPSHEPTHSSLSQSRQTPSRSEGLLAFSENSLSSDAEVMGSSDGQTIHSTPDLQNNRRSNSLNSLSDSDLMVNSAPLLDCNSLHSHKRSSSLTNNHQAGYEDISPEHTQQIHPQEDYSRFSVEGLNQEISSALEGKSLAFQFSHPDGHIAPVNDIVKGGVTHITVSTTPINIYSSPPLTPSSPTITSSSSDDLSSSTSALCLQHHRNSPAPRCSPSSIYPSSPKSSFHHRPPDGAERVNSKIFYPDNYVPKGPDRSKANIVFNGSVFSPPLLPSAPAHHSIEALTIS